MKLDPYVTPHIKMGPRPNVSTNTMKRLEGNRVNLHGFGGGIGFLYVTLRAQKRGRETVEATQTRSQGRPPEAGRPQEECGLPPPTIRVAVERLHGGSKGRDAQAPVWRGGGARTCAPGGHA